MRSQCQKILIVDDELELENLILKKFSNEIRNAKWLFIFVKGNKLLYGYAGVVTTDAQGLVEAVSTDTARDSEMRTCAEVMEKANLI